MAKRTGFGEDPAARGYDITQGYRDYNTQFDKSWVKEQVAPYKDYGLSQNLSDYGDKSDRQLSDLAAAAVIKMAKANGTIGKKPPTPDPTPTPTPTPKPPTPKPPKPKPTPKPKPPKKKPKKKPTPGVSPNPRAPHERDPFPLG